MNTSRTVRLWALGLLVSATACDALGGGSGSGTGDDGPLTTCIYGYTKGSGAGGYGASCSSGADCEYGVCIKPGDTGNYSNTQFAFCSRGCDCDNATAAQIPADQKEALECLYPSTAEGKDARHIVPNCPTKLLEECTAINPAYTTCAPPDHGGSGHICQAL